MDCADVRESLARGAVPEGAVAQAHVAICDACRTLLADGARIGRALAGAAVDAPPPADLDALFAQVGGAVARETGVRAWLRSRKTHHRVAVVATVAVVTALLVLLISGQDPIAGGVAPVIARVLYAGLALAAITAGLRSLSRGPAPAVRAPAILASAVLLPLAIAFFPTDAPMHDVGAAQHLTCLAFGLALGLPALLVARLADRGGRARALALLLLATGAGLVGVTALEMECALRDPEHLLLGHATVVLGYLATGSIARAWVRRAA